MQRIVEKDSLADCQGYCHFLSESKWDDKSVYGFTMLQVNDLMDQIKIKYKAYFADNSLESFYCFHDLSLVF